MWCRRGGGLCLAAQDSAATARQGSRWTRNATMDGGRTVRRCMRHDDDMMIWMGGVR